MPPRPDDWTREREVAANWPALEGRRIGPYLLTARLGAGGMGEVYRARDSKLGRDVAIKMLPPHFLTDPERRVRFEREARLLATLNHPHIGIIYGLEETADASALVLELVEGPTLEERLKSGPMPLIEALGVARQVADALDSAHHKHIVHRDLKPANIVLQREPGAIVVDPRVKVLDFGLATTVVEGLGPGANSITEQRTEVGRILGTPAYMSPEQARGQTVDKRTDVWAFGCVLFEMLSGQRAFAGDTTTDTLARVLERDPEWASLPSETPASIRTLLRRCLRKDPEKRLHDIADARIEIDECDLVAVSSPGDTRRPWPLAWIVATLVVLSTLAAVTTVLHVRRDVTGPAPELFEFAVNAPENATLRLGYGGFAVAPDGRQIVVIASANNQSSLWVRPVGRPEYRQLLGTEGAIFPFWRPDGSEIGFFAGGKLKTVPVRGGVPSVICDAPEIHEGTDYDEIGGTWNRDDVIIFMSSAFTLQKVAARPGASQVAITTLGKGETAHRWPFFLPDGDHFLYVVVGEPGDLGEIRIGSLSSTASSSLGRYESDARYSAGHLLFVSGGQLVARRFDASTGTLTGPTLPVVTTLKFATWNKLAAFSVSESGVLAYHPGGPIVTDQRLTWRDRSGRPKSTVGDVGRFPTLDVSPDGKRLAVAILAKSGNQTDIWIIDLTRGGDAVPLTSDPAWEFDPGWSHDGNKIAFNSNRIGGRFGLFLRPSNGSGSDELLAAPQVAAETPVWLPGDRAILYGDDGDVWIRPLEGRSPPSALWRTPARERAASLSPDGRWIAYTSDKSGRMEIYVRAFPSGDTEHKVSLEGGVAPRWRGDNGEIFFLSLDATMMAARVDTSKPFKAMIPESLFATGLSLTNLRPYAVAADGQQFLIPMSVDPRASPPLTVLSDWQARLPK
jgi:eukaryotic-like serine/threonine-protein kinase